MSEFLVLQQIPDIPLGLLERGLKAKGATFDVLDLSKTPNDRRKVKNYAGLIVLGGPESVNNSKNEGIRATLRFTEHALGEVAFFGVCLGMQAAAKVAGARVVRSNPREWGLRGPTGQQFSVKLTNNAQHKKFFKGLPKQFGVFEAHDEMVEPTKDMTVAGIGNFCNSQIIIFDENAFASQFHPELGRKKVGNWADNAPGLQDQNREQLINDFDTVLDTQSDLTVQETQEMLSWHFSQNFVDLAR